MQPSKHLPCGGCPDGCLFVQRSQFFNMLTDGMKFHYYRCLQNWETEPSNLRNTCGLAQDRFQQMLEFFIIQRLSCV